MSKVTFTIEVDDDALANLCSTVLTMLPGALLAPGVRDAFMADPVTSEPAEQAAPASALDGDLLAAADLLQEIHSILSSTEISDSAIHAAEQQAKGTGWTFDLASSWGEELYATRNGRLLHELPVAMGHYASAEQMLKALARKPGPHALTGFTGGVSKRFATWSAATPGADQLEMPIVTQYLSNVTGFQRAQGFGIDADLVPLFRLALAATLR